MDRTPASNIEARAQQTRKRIPPPSARARRHGRGPWPLRILVAATSLSLCLTIFLFLRALPPMLQASPIDSATVKSLTRITIGATQRAIETNLRNPAEILRQAGVSVDEADRLWVNGALAHVDALPGWSVPAYHIEIRHAARVTVIDAGQESSIESRSASVGDALREAGIALHPADHVQPPRDRPLNDGLRIHIQRALPLSLLVDGVEIEARSRSATVGEVLTELNAPLFGEDYVKPPADSPLSAGLRIEVVRVREEVLASSEAIDFDTVYQKDDSLPLDRRRTLQEGKAGRRETRVRVRYENGVEVSREPLETLVAEAPVNKIVAYGAQLASLGTVPGTDLQYWRRICVLATYYKPDDDGFVNQTATGAPLQKGVIAAKPQIIPYGTTVYVPGYGQGKILDTGGGLPSTPYWIDLFYPSKLEAEQASAHTRYTWVYHLFPAPKEVHVRLPAWQPARKPSGSCS